MALGHVRLPGAPDSATSLSGSTRRAGAEQSLRRFGLGAQVLSDLGVSKLKLLTNSQRKIVGLTGYGLEVVERVALELEEK